MNKMNAFLLLISLVLITSAVPIANAQFADQLLLEAAVYARKLVNASTWGVVSNYAYNLDNIPFGNLVSFADRGTGTPYFFLTTLDYTTANFSAIDQRTSLTIGQIALGSCGIYDPQEPVCGKVTLSGLLKPVRRNSREERVAKDELFQRHQRFKKLQKFAINFQVYKLEVNNIYVVNNYGPPKFPSRKLYYNVKF